MESNLLSSCDFNNTPFDETTSLLKPITFLIRSERHLNQSEESCANEVDDVEISSTLSEGSAGGPKLWSEHSTIHKGRRI